MAFVLAEQEKPQTKSTSGRQLCVYSCLVLLAAVHCTAPTSSPVSRSVCLWEEQE